MQVNTTSITELLEKLEIDFKYIEHERVFSVAESKNVIEEKRPIKNLFIHDQKRDQLYMVIMDGDARLDMKMLKTLLDSNKLSFAKEALLLEKLDVTPGSVSLYGLMHENAKDVKVLFDETLLDEPALGFHPNDNSKTIFISGKNAIFFIEHLGNEYSVVDLKGKHE